MHRLGILAICNTGQAVADDACMHGRWRERGGKAAVLDAARAKVDSEADMRQRLPGSWDCRCAPALWAPLKLWPLQAGHGCASCCGPQSAAARAGLQAWRVGIASERCHTPTN